MTIKKVDLRNRDYQRCTCCQLVLHRSQFWLGDQPCGACQREKCLKNTCRLGMLHEH